MDSMDRPLMKDVESFQVTRGSAHTYAGDKV